MCEDKIEKISALIVEAKQFGIEVLPPDINKSNYNFTIISDTLIRYGIAGLKGVGEKVINPIIAERENGEFKSLTDLVWRTGVDFGTIKTMAKAGCFDWKYSRKQLLNNESKYVEDLCSMISWIKKRTEDVDVFDTSSDWITIPAMEEYLLSELINLELDVLGIWLSADPFELYADVIDKLKKDNVQQSKYRKTKDLMFGYPIDVVPFKNGNGAIFKLAGQEMKFMAFKNRWIDNKHLFTGDTKRMLVISCSKSNRDEEGEDVYFVDSVSTIENEAGDGSLIRDAIAISVDLKNPGNLDSLRLIKISKTGRRTVRLKMIGENVFYDIPVGYLT